MRKYPCVVMALVLTPVVCLAEQVPTESADIHVTAGALVDAYRQTLKAQARFACKYTIEQKGEWEGSSVPVPSRYLNRLNVLHSYCSGEYMTDGRRAAHRERQWGQIRSDQVVPKEDPEFRRDTFDGEETWAFFKAYDATHTKHGRLCITPAGRNALQHEFVKGFGPAGPLLGVLSNHLYRMDELLAEGKLDLRPIRPSLNGVPCHVIDYISPHGRGTVWIDPQHGYNLARAEFKVRSGDTIRRPSDRRWIEYTARPGFSQERSISDVCFENIQGVWFPCSGTYEQREQSTGYREESKNKIVLSNIVLNPDLDKLNAFSTADIEEGAECIYAGQLGVNLYVWKHGRVVANPVPAQAPRRR